MAVFLFSLVVKEESSSGSDAKAGARGAFWCWIPREDRSSAARIPITLLTWFVASPLWPYCYLLWGLKIDCVHNRNSLPNWKKAKLGLRTLLVWKDYGKNVLSYSFRQAVCASLFACARPQIRLVFSLHSKLKAYPLNNFMNMLH